MSELKNPGRAIIKFSEEYDKILNAMFEIQSTASDPIKDELNYFKKKYASLHSVKQALKEPMIKAKCIQTSAHSITLEKEFNPAYQKDWQPKTPKEKQGVQPPPALFICWVTVETTLFHVSGQWVRVITKLRSADSSPISIGICLTYGRRYNSLSLHNLAADDEDGGAASGNTEPPNNAKVGPTNKQLRSNLNQDLSKQFGEEGFQVVYKDFVNKYGDGKLSEKTTKGNETFKSLFDQHYSRINKECKDAKSAFKNKTDQKIDPYSKWKEEFLVCKGEKLFRKLEKQYIDNVDEWVSHSDEAEGILDEYGARLKLKDYLNTPK